jgi:hypothetical protein
MFGLGVFRQLTMFPRQVGLLRVCLRKDRHVFSAAMDMAPATSPATAVVMMLA